ncbi:pectinesterase inhibitor 2-like [Corylus avellana]|uniref:pectinesterase inhibitor 2-like n=1 Tax=Corylus avellana TaxID=13451 RepID=UPI00286D2406|nr:pectinesterase inhibitor 2-like [Corylus avellana]
MNTISCSKVFLVLLVSLFPIQILAQNAILAVCDEVTFKVLCKDTLQLDPTSTSATSFEDVAAIILKNTTSTATQISDQFTNLLNKRVYSGSKVALVNCIKDYQDAIRKLADTSKALQSRNYNDIKTGMIAAQDDGLSCDKDFRDFARNDQYLGANQVKTYIMLCSIVYQLTIN